MFAADQTNVVYQKFDLDMELLHPSTINKLKPKTVKINGTEIVQDHAVYKIQVAVGECNWSLKKRYRDFCSLHEDLVVHYGLPWDLLPPKKFIGNLNKDHIERRRIALEQYLQTILAVLLDLPKGVVEFLEFDRFDVNSVCHKLAKDLFEIGDSILLNNEVFTISPLQIHCINRRLLLPLPTCDSDDPREDIGHLYSFISQAKHIKVRGGEHDELFTGEHELTYDLSIFKSLETLELYDCDLETMSGIEFLQKQIWELKVHRSSKFLKDILITSESWNQGVLVEIDEGKQRHVSRFPTWENVVHAVFTNNEISAIDNTITLLPNIRKLDLSHNILNDVQFLEGFLYLRELDLSHNEFTDVEDFPYKLGNITVLNLAGNLLKDVKGLDKMYSLKRLRLSDNAIEQLANVLPLGNLPMLENIDLHGNPCTNEPFYNVRLIAQFGERYKHVTIDGAPTIKSDLAKALEILKLQNSYEVISGPENYYRPGITASSKDSEPVKQISTPKSPRNKPTRKEHVADIKPPPVKNNKQAGLSEMEKEEENFRKRIEKLREQAGDSWLTFYNEMNVEENDENKMSASQKPKSADAKSKVCIVEEEKDLNGEHKRIKPVNKVKPMHIAKDQIDLQDVTKQLVKNKIDGIVTEDKYEEQLPGSVFNVLEDMGDQDVDLLNETFLISKEDEKTGLIEECIISLDKEDNALLEIDLVTGRTVGHFSLAKIRNIRVLKEANHFWIVFDEEKEDDTEGVWLESKLRFLEAKDCAGLFALMMTFGQSENSDISDIETSEIPEQSKEQRAMPMDNPFHFKKEILLSFFQEFVQKTSYSKKDVDRKSRSGTSSSSSSLTYQNVGISVPFLKHTVNDTPQDVIVSLWAGCLPYLFPEEELPTCLVMTNMNIFLFRIFLPDDASPKTLPTTVKEIKELFHCFYSFSLKSIKEIVVGLYDQAFRIEVKEEGPRGTFTFLTRHASKTAEFLEAYCSVIGFHDEGSSLDVKRRTSFISVDQSSSIFYPDESKINALKEQLSAQDLNPLDDRENLISYCIVYVSDAELDDEDMVYSSDTPVSNIKSLILTNLRLFMCDEDYVHWPMPSFVRSLPRTPEWIVDEEEPVADLIGVDLWEDIEYKHTLVGNYGMTLTFDDSVAELTETVNNEACTKSWKIMFGSLSERDQFVRSLSCLWKNQFEQNLTVTYSKVTKTKPHLNADAISQTSVTPATNFKPCHSRGASGNLSSPWNGHIDSPEVIATLNPIRQRTYFMDNLAVTEEEGAKGPYYVMCSGCIPYLDHDSEITVTTLIGCSRIYLVVDEKNRGLINARKAIIDGSEGNPLWLAVVELTELRQVVVGLFDQFVRLEGDKPETTFTLVVRDHEKTNDFLQCLSQVLLLGKHENNPSNTRKDTAHNLIYKYYKDEDAESDKNDPKTEFIHPNSNVKVVYPSDESLEKLKQNILQFVSTTYQSDIDEDFGILLYLLVSAESEDGIQPCTLVISERFICILKEDYVNYPLPLFAKELPETPQYQPADVRLIAAIIRIEFQDLSAGAFTIVFNRAVVEPSRYDERFKIADVEKDVCLVTDMNTDAKVQEEQGVLLWKLHTQSFAEREKIFAVLSRMWSNSYSGRTLQIVKRKQTRLGDL